jgi:nucleotide-binding universal stress UspA family protein
MKGIIVGVDESSYARVALKWAVDYGADRDLPVTALMAWDYVLQHHVEPNPSFDPDYGSQNAAKVLDELVARAVGAENHVAQTVVCENPGHALIDAAGTDASLVVVGARGMSGFQGLLMGSVSRYVLHAAHGPVAVIRTDAARVDDSVVVGLDGSESSRRAMAWALDYARCRRSRLIALHAWFAPYSPFGLYAPPDLAKLAAAAQRFVEHEVDQIDATGLVAPVEARSVEGRASAALLEASCLASLVVVGSRGRGRFANSLLGSVSDQVSHYATCPAVVVP